MAIRFAVASGNWSNTATWNGGTLPAAADDVFSNNFTVTIDQDITAISLRNTPRTSPTIAQGGFFNVTGNTGTRNVTLTGTIVDSVTTSGLFAVNAATPVLYIASTSGATVNLNFPLGYAQLFVTAMTLITGNAIVNYVGVTKPAYLSYFFRINSTASFGTLNIISNIETSPNASVGAIYSLCPNYTINLVGNVLVNGDAGFLIQAATNVNITGNIIANVTNGINIQSAGTNVNITGNITSAAASAITASTNCVITLNGNVTASSAAVGILSTNLNALVTVNGNLINTNDIMAVQSFKMRISPTSQQVWTFQTSGPNRLLYTSNALSDFPAITDVRNGVTYAAGTLTGSCVIPSTSSVAFGVPVGNSTGSAIITRAQFLADIGAIASSYNI
jgi:hypothetical protein